MFSRNVLVKVLIWHLPEHELSPSEGLWGGPRRSLGHHGASGGALGGRRVALGGLLGSLWGPWEGPGGSLGGPGDP